MKVITSRENRIYRQTLKLLRKKSRDDTGTFLLEGVKPLRDALESGLMIEKIFACSGKSEKRGGSMDAMKDGVLPDADAPDWIPREKLILLDERLFADLSDTVHSQGIIAVARKPVLEAEDFLSTAAGPLLVLDRIRDPGNAGTMIRTAEAAGFGGILALKGTTDLYGPKTVRAAAGSLLRMPVLTSLTEDRATDLIRGSGRPLVVTALAGAEDCFHVDLPAFGALVIGNEGEGVSPGLLEAADLRVKIPMAGRMESLNAAVAAGILMYQIGRGRELSQTEGAAAPFEKDVDNAGKVTEYTGERQGAASGSENTCADG